MIPGTCPARPDRVDAGVLHAARTQPAQRLPSGRRTLANHVPSARLWWCSVRKPIRVVYAGGPLSMRTPPAGRLPWGCRGGRRQVILSRRHSYGAAPACVTLQGFAQGVAARRGRGSGLQGPRRAVGRRHGDGARRGRPRGRRALPRACGASSGARLGRERHAASDRVRARPQRQRVPGASTTVAPAVLPLKIRAHCFSGAFLILYLGLPKVHI